MDANPAVFLPDSYVYNGKLVSDLYLSYRFSDAVHFALGADNLFNVHPDLGFVEGAAGWAYNNEPGGLLMLYKWARTEPVSLVN